MKMGGKGRYYILQYNNQHTKIYKEIFFFII
jgi:hypothetical protein